MVNKPIHFASARTASPNILVHSSKGLFVVNIIEEASYRLLTTSKNSSTWLNGIFLNPTSSIINKSTDKKSFSIVKYVPSPSADINLATKSLACTKATLYPFLRFYTNSVCKMSFTYSRITHKYGILLLFYESATDYI